MATALKSEDDKVVKDVPAGEAASPGGDDEQGKSNHDQVIFEGDQPTSDSTGNPPWLKQRVARFNRKIAAAEEGKTEAERKAELLAEENKLLRMRLNQGSDRPPRSSDFDTDAEFDAALQRYNQQQIEARARQIAQEEIERNRAAATQGQQDEQTETQLNKHYDRAGSLKVPDYAETEDKAIEILGEDLFKFIVASTDKAHVLLYGMGKNPAKAMELVQKVQANPGRGAVFIGELAAAAKVKSAAGSDVPEPDDELSGGGAPQETIWQRKYDKLLAKVAANDGSASMKDIRALKAQAKEAGVTLTL